MSWYLEVSRTEIASGIAFAKKGGKKNKKGEQKYPPTDLDEDRLRSVVNRTLKLRAEGVKFPSARDSVLCGEFRERNRRSQELRNAYSATIGHICGKRNSYKQKARVARKKPKQRFAQAPNGQFEFHLPRRAGH